ncbi:hypothetical protein SAMN04489740_2733 [Arthrobacter alpinus]|uniref:Uncharacterized protein n=1 Tax=Arthrobacter alpinus TaxID=656366 RepID=A0A1H5M3I8_9MICC|nr:hypothetical protein [Arthrobacter alpinus]SEE83825.1 hypothetical protein SAMN04489740_2733 [Arthrobacter alpinus]
MNSAEAELEAAIRRIMREQNVTRNQAEPVARASIRLEEAKAERAEAMRLLVRDAARKHYASL